MKNHLKRISAPRTWVIDRKIRTFIVRPNPGAHSLDMGLPLGLLLRDHLSLAATTSEVRKLLHAHEVLVDGKRRKDHRHIVGLFDVLSFSDTKQAYRVVLDNKGRLVLIEIPEGEAQQKLCKIVGKKLVRKGIVTYHLHDGRTLRGEFTAKVGDSLLLDLSTNKVKQVVPLQEGSAIVLMKGKHGGDQGTVKSLSGNEATYLSNEGDVETAKKYLFVTGEKTPLLKVAA